MRTLNLLLSTPMAPADGSVGGGALEAIGAMKPIDRNAENAGAAVVDMINTHRGALLELEKSGTKTREALERMQAELAPKIQASRFSAGLAWNPEGETAQAEARYMDGETLRLGTRQVSMPEIDANGEVVFAERSEFGFLTDPRPVTPAQKRAQDAYGEYALVRALGAKSRAPEALRKTTQRAYRNFARAMCDVPGQIGAWSRGVFNDPVRLRAVISGASGSGGELIKSPTLATVIRPTDIQRRIVSNIQTIEAESSTFKKPVLSGRVLLRKRQAIADDPSRYTVTTMTTSDSTLTLVKLVAQVLLDADFATDAGLILGDAIGYIRMLLAQGKADSLEMMFLHGDTAGTHQDTLSSWTMGSRYSAGALAGTESQLTGWIGMRARAFDNSASVAGGGSFTATTHFNALNKLGANAAGARMAVGLAGFYSQILSNSLFTTWDKAGAAATLQTGQLGQVGDTPIDLTDFLAAEYASTGLYTGSGSTNTFVYYTPAGWRYFVHSAGGTEWDVTYPEKGAQYVGIKEEGLLDASIPSTENNSAVIINL